MNPLSPRRTCLIALAVSVIAVLAVPHPARADNIDLAMIRESKAIVAAVNKLGAKNIAVLRFQVQLKSEKQIFQYGTMGSEMVRRVQNVLLLSADEKNPAYNVLAAADERASALARQTTQSAVDWTTPEGRKKLFELKLPVAWDSAKELPPDGYLTGFVQVSPDFKKITLELRGFTKAAPAELLDLMTPLEVQTDQAMLASMGVGSDIGPAARGGANDPANPQEKKPLDARPFPLKLEVLFDGRVATLEPDAGGLGYRVANPAAGLRQRQSVTFGIQNTGTERVAVLLCVNKRNTIAVDDENLLNDDKPLHKFRMWVLEPNKKYAVKGYLLDESGRFSELFLPDDPASQGRDTIQVFVYPERSPAPNPPNNNPPKAPENLEGLAGDSSAAFSSIPRGLGETGSLSAAKAKIRAHIETQTTRSVPQSAGRGGANTPGPTTAHGKVEIVPFECDPQPLYNLVITHHNKESR